MSVPMKSLVILALCVMGIPFTSFSQTPDVSSELTNLISSFANHIPKDFKNDKEHFYLIEFDKDTSLSYEPKFNFDVLKIRYIETKYHLYTYNDFRIINGEKVYFHGKGNSFFSFDANDRVKIPYEADPFLIIDPLDYEWQIVLFDDGSVNEFLTQTNIVHSGRDSTIDNIVAILKQPDSLVVEKWLSNHIFGLIPDVLVDNEAEPIPNEESIRAIVRKYNIKHQKGLSSVSCVFIIDEQGNAKYFGTKNEDAAGVNKEKIGKICKEIEDSVVFSPAIHRGRTVKSTFILYFLY